MSKSAIGILLRESAMGIAAWIGFGLLAAWLFASAIGQIPCALQRRLQHFDYAGLIPRWNFFAPQPGMWNYHLVYRDQLADGAITPWTEVNIVDPRRMSHGVWNPHRRLKKAFFDLVTQLMRNSLDRSPNELMMTVPYLMLLTWVSSFPRADGATGTQFAIVFGYGATSDEAPKPGFVSAMHPL